MERVLLNIVDLVIKEYQYEFVILMKHITPPFRLMLCGTTYIFTSSIRQLLIEGNKDLNLRVLTRDFEDYGGKCKAISTGFDKDNYRKVMTTGI
jgi:hypothetical protein